MTETLPTGRKLVTISWEEAHLWILTRPMKTNEVAETYTLDESSAFGVFQGHITIVESK